MDLCWIKYLNQFLFYSGYSIVLFNYTIYDSDITYIILCSFIKFYFSQYLMLKEKYFFFLEKIKFKKKIIIIIIRIIILFIVRRKR